MGFWRGWHKQGSGSFLKERTKKRFPLARMPVFLARAQTDKVFLLLFVHKKKILT
jgi:hypothetical protein